MAPPWIVQRAEIQFSEWRDWAEVAGAFTPLYDELRRHARRNRRGDPAHRNHGADACGKGLPRCCGLCRAPFAIWRCRWAKAASPRPLAGDLGNPLRRIAKINRNCSWRWRAGSASMLPALVNTSEGYALDEWLPTAYAFNHCIVRLAIGGQVYWLDPHPRAATEPPRKYRPILPGLGAAANAKRGRFGAHGGSADSSLC